MGCFGAIAWWSLNALAIGDLESRNGCSPPGWKNSWSMADSLYMYCYEPCPINWLANNTQYGTFGGVVGYVCTLVQHNQIADGGEKTVTLKNKHKT